MEVLDFKTKLLELDATPIVTIMVNTHVAAGNVEQGVLQFKNLAKSSKERFSKKNSTKNWEPYQNQIDQILQDTHVFRDGARSLAFIFTPKESFTFPLEIEVDDQYYVSDLPYFLALIKNTQFNYHYYLLGLNRDSMSLYEVNNRKLEKISLPKDAPIDLKTALGDELTGGNLNYSSQGSGGNGKEGVAYHGVSTKDEEEEIDHLNYYQAVDNFLKEYLPNKKIPLYLMALPENHALYKKVSKLDNFDSEFSLNMALSATDKNMIQKDLPKLNAQIEKKEIEEYNKLMDRKFVDQLVDISQNAELGKISHLFIATSNLTDGFGEDPDEEYDRRQVLNKIAYKVLKNAGEVHLLDQHDAPDEKSLVAILRY